MMCAMSQPRRMPPALPRDVLAAEEFGIGAGDPGLHREPAHDILAAEEFPVPAGDPRPIKPEPAHDILAAEEFALPGSSPHEVPPEYAAVLSTPSWRGRPAGLVLALAVVMLATLLVRGRRRQLS